MKKPLVFVVMDGVGFGKDPEGDAVKQAAAKQSAFGRRLRER